MSGLPEIAFDYSRAGTVTWAEYMDKLMDRIRMKDVETELAAKFLRARREIRVRRRLSDRDLLSLRAFITPWNVELRSPAGVPFRFRILCNSAIKLKGDRLGIYLRLGSIGIFPLGCRLCRTIIAYTELPLEEVRGEVKVKADSVLYPLVSGECIEDPRVDPDDPSDLYHVRGYYLFWRVKGIDTMVLMFRAKLEGDTKVKFVDPIAFRRKDGELFLLRDYRDSFPVSRRAMMLRPWLTHLDTGGVFVGPREDTIVEFDELEPVPELLPLPSEKKSGGNCSVKISSNEYLVLFHVVEGRFGAYYHFAAVFSETGELLGVTEEPVISPGLGIYSGTRPATVFVCGAAVHKDKLLVSAGKDDEILLIYEGDLQRVLDAMHWLKG